MTQILIIENDETLRKLIKLNLMKTAGCDVVEMKSSKEAIELLRILPEMDMIICREVMKGDQAALNISSYLFTEKLATPFLIIGNRVSAYEPMTTMPANSEWRDIVSTAAKIMGSDVKSPEKLPDFVPVSISYFMNIESLYKGCDVFIRVKKNENEFQYVKRLHAGDIFSREDILRYQEGGLSDFFIAKDQFLGFVNFVTEDLLKKLSYEKLSAPDRVTLSSDAFKVTQEMIQAIGIDDMTVQLVEESIASMTALLKEQNNLAMFLKALKADECSYAYAHSYLCCLILHKIITQFDWQSPQIKENLVFISFFHDISLNGNGLSEINTKADFDNIKFEGDDRIKVLSHALESAKIVDQFPKIPQGIGAIIKEHHGSKTGVGFVETYSANLMPLSMMFIVTENFVDALLKIPGTPKSTDMKKIFSEMQPKFNKSTYGQTLDALQNMTIRK